MTCHRFDENRFGLVTVLPVAGGKRRQRNERQRKTSLTVTIFHMMTQPSLCYYKGNVRNHVTRLHGFKCNFGCPFNNDNLFIAKPIAHPWLQRNFRFTTSFFFFLFFSSIYEKVFDNLLELWRRPRKRTSAAVLVSIFAPKMITTTKSGVLMFSGPAAAIIKEQNNKRANFSFYFCCC